MNWKQNIGAGHIDAQKGKELLKNFRYPTEIDKKNRLLIDDGFSKYIVVLKPNGEDSTIIGVSRFKMKVWVFFLSLVFLCVFILPGLVFVGLVNSKRKKVFTEAVRLMNQNLDKLDKSNTTGSLESKLSDLKQLREKDLISEEEFETKKKAILMEY